MDAPSVGEIVRLTVTGKAHVFAWSAVRALPGKVWSGFPSGIASKQRDLRPRFVFRHGPVQWSRQPTARRLTVAWMTACSYLNGDLGKARALVAAPHDVDRSNASISPAW